MRLFAAAFVLSSLATIPALAQEAADKPFEGASVTVIGGIDAGRRLGETEVGPLYGGQLGYDWQVNGLVFGIEGEGAHAANRHCFTVRQPGGGDGRYCSRPDHDVYAGGRIGVVAGETTLFYGKAGYASAHQLYDLLPGAAGSPAISGSDTRDGFGVGAGIETRVGGDLTLKAEYRFSDYGDGYRRHQGAVGLGFRF